MDQLRKQLEGWEETISSLQSKVNDLILKKDEALRASGCPIVFVSSTGHYLAAEEGHYFLVSNQSAEGCFFCSNSDGFFVEVDEKRISLKEWDSIATLEWCVDQSSEED